ncbi:MAG: hypothetical protein ABI208_04030 [Ginsengibacter sp.]|jgi:polyhydroxyalkanoate synthesis regulator phasin
MKKTLKKLKNITSNCCVTIILQTHRTLPDNEKDSLVLKNLIKEAESRLSAEYEKPFVSEMMKRINDLAKDINHKYNKESLALFVNENIAEFIRMPISVEDRVVIDKSFATRDIVRALNKEIAYYVLVLGRDKARLIEAFNDKMFNEIEDNFPFENRNLNPVQRSEASIGRRQTNLTQEFFNRVDKQLNELWKENPLPVIICADENNYSEYLQIADKKEIIVGHLKGNRLHEKAHHIIEAAWPIMNKLNIEKVQQRISELKTAVNSRNFLIDYNEIWQAVNNGKGKTLFVKQGHFQPAILENNHIELVSKENIEKANVDDIIDEMVEKNLQSNGDAIFINGDELEKFNGLVLVTKY